MYSFTQQLYSNKVNIRSSFHNKKLKTTNNNKHQILHYLISYFLQNKMIIINGVKYFQNLGQNSPSELEF